MIAAYVRRRAGRALLAAAVLMPVSAQGARAQVAPSAQEADAYRGLLAAAHRNDGPEIAGLVKAGAATTQTDAMGRAALHIAAHAGAHEALRALVAAGADANAFDAQRYDAVTIAAVANDVATLRVALQLGCRADNITSPYEGTALIAAAHLGHVEVVKTLIAAGAPLDHVNNLGWTALIEAIVLGDGGSAHTETVRALVQAGASLSMADRQGATPLDLARSRGYTTIIAILEAAPRR